MSRALATALAFGALCLAAGALAQVPPSTRDQIERPGDGRTPLPAPRLEREDKRFELPPVPPPVAPRALPPSGIRIDVTRIELADNALLPAVEARKLIAPYEGRTVDANELEALRRQLSAAIVARGYINSGVVFPDQDLADGVVRMEVVAGALSEIEVTGLGRLRPGYVLDRLALDIGPPLDVERLRDRLRLLLQDPLIEGLSARLRPGLRPGESELELDVTRARAWDFGLAVANDRSPSIGATHASAFATLRNLTGLGDRLDLELGLTEGLRHGSAAVALPITAHDTTLSAFIERNASDVVEAPFDRLDIESRSNTYRLALRHPVYRTPASEAGLGLALARRDSETRLLGRPFSFSPGVRNGRSVVATIEATQDFTHRETEQVIALRSTFRLGVDALDATMNRNAPDGEFLAWLAQAQWIRRVPLDIGFGDGLVVLRGDLQLSTDGLLPLEKLAIGGADSVRGYRENQITRDAGVIASLEGRLPVYRRALELPGLGRRDALVQLAAFVDYGRGWNLGGNRLTEDLLSAGGGLKLSLGRHIEADLYVGHAFIDIADGADGNLQDAGIHFRLVVRPF